jgi:hypothetical protein
VVRYAALSLPNNVLDFPTIFLLNTVSFVSIVQRSEINGLMLASI